MSALKWATALVVAGAVAAPAGVAMADDDPAPTPTPPATPTPTPSPTPPANGPIDGVGNGNTVYVITVTTTTTTVNAPITWVAAPITTTVNNNSSSTNTSSTNSNSTNSSTGLSRTAATGRLELNLTGCKKPPAKTAKLKRPVHQKSQLRVPGDAALLVRVNGRSVGTVQLAGAVKGKGVPLSIKLDANGRLTVKRPSGRILQVQACTPK